jgi:hypothetical protein
LRFRPLRKVLTVAWFWSVPRAINRRKAVAHVRA